MDGLQRNLTATIRNRHSVRTFTGDLPQSEIAELGTFIAGLPAPPFKTAHRYTIVEAGIRGIDKVPGTYGVVRGAPCFLCGTAANTNRSLLDFAYLFEMIVLRATALGLATCWIGGTFNRSSFAARCQLGPDEILPAICPLGYAAAKPSLTDRFGRMTARSRKRKPFGELFFDGGISTPLTAAKAGCWQTPLEMVRLAPSAVNRQPWRVVRDGNVLHFLRQPSGMLKKTFSDFDMQMLDMGIAMCHFELTARQSGIEGSWTAMRYPPPKNLTYVISFEAKI